MKCEGCVNSVKNKLQTLDGVKNVDVDLRNQVVRVLGTSPVKILIEALEQTGRKAQLIGQGVPEDPYMPKNDKVFILTDTIQLLKDLTTQLTHEKNDLREEKASLNSDTETLNAQYQQRLRSMYPWLVMDHYVVMHPPSYPFSNAYPTVPIPMHPSIQPYHYYGNQNPATVVPYAVKAY